MPLLILIPCFFLLLHQTASAHVFFWFGFACETIVLSSLDYLSCKVGPFDLSGGYGRRPLAVGSMAQDQTPHTRYCMAHCSWLMAESWLGAHFINTVYRIAYTVLVLNGSGLMLMISGPSHHFTARIVFDLCVLSICVPSVAEGKLVFIIEAYN